MEATVMVASLQWRENCDVETGWRLWNLGSSLHVTQPECWRRVGESLNSFEVRRGFHCSTVLKRNFGCHLKNTERGGHCVSYPPKSPENSGGMGASRGTWNAALGFAWLVVARLPMLIKPPPPLAFFANGLCLITPLFFCLPWVSQDGSGYIVHSWIPGTGRREITPVSTPKYINDLSGVPRNEANYQVLLFSSSVFSLIFFLKVCIDLAWTTLWSI